jgi:hypothetical protein
MNKCPKCDYVQNEKEELDEQGIRLAGLIWAIFGIVFIVVFLLGFIVNWWNIG